MNIRQEIEQHYRNYPDYLSYLDVNYGRLLESYPLPSSRAVVMKGTYKTVSEDSLSPKGTRIKINTRIYNQAKAVN